jgi:uncharacterized protein DUF779
MSATKTTYQASGQPGRPVHLTPRVTATPAALTTLARLREQRGPVILYQTSGCADGSSPICFVRGDLLIGDGDLLLGQVGDCPVYSRRHPGAGPFLQVRLNRLTAAADEAIAATRGGDSASLRRVLNKFEALTSAMWTVQRTVREPALARPPSGRPGPEPSAAAR